MFPRQLQFTGSERGDPVVGSVFMSITTPVPPEPLAHMAYGSLTKLRYHRPCPERNGPSSGTQNRPGFCEATIWDPQEFLRSLRFFANLLCPPTTHSPLVITEVHARHEPQTGIPRNFRACSSLVWNIF